MKKSFQLVAVVCLAINAHAQNLTTVTASSLYKGGIPLSSGQICFTGTDGNDNPIPFRVGGGGQEVTFPYCATVTNGAIVGTFQVANPALTAPVNISYRVELFDQYNRLQKWSGVQFTGATFNFDNYIPSANLPLGTSANVATIGNLTVTGSCTGCGGGGGGGSGYSTIQIAGTALAQRATANFFSGITCADNSGSSRTDCQIDTGSGFSPTFAGSFTFNGSTNLAGGFKINGAAAAGKIPIGDGTNFVPGDPLVQGLNAEGSTATNNPVNIGGFDTAGTPAIHGTKVLNAAPAGTEYGIVTRNIPSGTQTVSISGTPSVSISGTPAVSVSGTATVSVSNTPAVTSSQLPSALDGSGFLKVHEQGTATVSGTVTTTPPSHASTNVDQLNGTTIDTNSGTKSAGTQRVVIATDQPQLTNPLKVDGSGVTQPVSGTVTANAGTGTFNIQSNASVNVNQVAGNAVAADSNGRQILKIYPDTTTTSYSASSKFAASSTTDNAVMPGNATNTLLVTEVRLTCTQTTAGILNVELLKRSTADTSGTSSNLTVVPDDANYAAGVSVPKSYTGTGPTVGTAVGDLDNAQIGCMASGTVAPNDIYIFRPAKPIVLRGTAQQIALNLGGVVTVGTITVTYKWMETTTP